MKFSAKNLMFMIYLVTFNILYPSAAAEFFSPTDPAVLKIIKQIEAASLERHALQEKKGQLDGEILLNAEIQSLQSKKKHIADQIKGRQEALATKRTYCTDVARLRRDEDAIAKLVAEEKSIDEAIKNEAPKMQIKKLESNCLESSIMYVQRIINTLGQLQKTIAAKIKAERIAQEFEAHFKANDQSAQQQTQEDAQEKAIGTFTLSNFQDFIKKYNENAANPATFARIANKEPHRILGIKPNFTEDDVKKAFKALSLQWHPDRNKDNPQANEIYQLITAANETALKKLGKK